MASVVGHSREAERLTLSSSAEDTEVERDIDGVPLRDHKKVDLKLILGHTPEVDDDEDEAVSGDRSQQPTEVLSLPGVTDDAEEFEYGYSDGNEEVSEEEMEDKERQLHRRSSLKTIHTPDLSDDSPGHKKAVRFADALGLGLAAVRDLINADEPPEIPHSALKDLRIRKKRSKLSEQFHLVLGFVQPSADPEFMTRMQQRKVILENCVTSDRALTVSGVIRVANISFEKRVTIRYTTDDWSSFRNASTMYVPNSNDGATDRFMFVVHLPEGLGHGKGCRRLEFAIKYDAGDQVYWDSNGGCNYAIDCVLVPVSPRGVQPDCESSGSEGEFII